MSPHADGTSLLAATRMGNPDSHMVRTGGGADPVLGGASLH